MGPSQRTMNNEPARTAGVQSGGQRTRVLEVRLPRGRGGLTSGRGNNY